MNLREKSSCWRGDTRLIVAHNFVVDLSRWISLSCPVLKLTFVIKVIIMVVEKLQIWTPQGGILPLCQNLSRCRSCWRSRSESATGTWHAKWIKLKDKDKHKDKEIRINAMTEYSLAQIWNIMEIAMMVMTTIRMTTLPSSQTPSQRSQRLSPPQHTGHEHQGHIS